MGVIARDVTTVDISATIFDENFEIQTGVFQFEAICDGCYAIVCQTGHVIRRYPQKHNVPVISCHDGRWKFENPRKAGVLESATSSQNVLKSKLTCKKRVAFWEGYKSESSDYTSDHIQGYIDSFF